MQQGTDLEAHPLGSRLQHNNETDTGNLPGDSGTRAGSSSRESQESPIVEDFDDSANALWSLYGKEAKGHDTATIRTIKDDMDSVLIFAGLFSAALTAFIIDRAQGIQLTPAQQSVFFQKQSVALLEKISQQLTSLGAASDFPISSLPEFTVNPSKSDVRVNICWFWSLVFSLSAALLATLVQRWARDHMHIFQRYSHPLKIARIRQYLHEGVEGWYMLAIAEAIPGLIHTSLFLFLGGLADFLLNTPTCVGKFIVFPISLCAALYFFSTVAPVVNPQSPYRTPFSGLVWCLSRKLGKRLWHNRFGVDPKPLCSNMADEQMQLAMEKNDARKGRDERAIRWLVRNFTEDIEMESLASGIPGSFDARWGVEVWKIYTGSKKGQGMTGSSTVPEAELIGDNGCVPRPPFLRLRNTCSTFLSSINTFFSTLRLGPSRPPVDPTGLPPTHLDPIPIPLIPLPVRREAVDELCLRIQRLFETCNHRDAFMNEDEWRKRSRACVETAASFVFCMDADIRSFGKIGKLLSDLGNAERTCEVTTTSLNWSFTTRWTCLSLVATRKMLNSPELRAHANGTILTLGAFDHEDNSNYLETALRNAQTIDEQFAAAWDCVEDLRQAFNTLGVGISNGEGIELVLAEQRPELERIHAEAEGMRLVDKRIADLQSRIDGVTHNLTRQLPGVVFDDLTGPTPIGQVFEFLANPVQPQLVYMSPRLLGLSTLRQRRSSRGYFEMTEVLKTVENIPPSLHPVVRQRHLMERQLWRLHDISVGGAFGFTLELYFISLKRILSEFSFPPREIYITFYVGAFRAITSDWERFRGGLGTQQIILNLVCDIAVRDRGIFSNFTYPEFITKELLKLLGNIVEGLTDSYIDSALNELRDVGWRLGDQSFRDSAVATIVNRRRRRRRAPPSEFSELELS